jgi:hypothetical protein
VTLRSRIAVDAEELRRRGGHPERLYLTTDDAICLQYELLSEGGLVAQRIMSSGLRQAISAIDGLTIIWRSEHFAVV